MFRSFYFWYRKKLKKKPIIIIVGSFITLFAALGSIYSGFNAISAFSNLIKSHYFENEFIYERLKKINTGLDINFVETIIGKPAITKRLPSQMTENVKSENNEWVEKKTFSELDNYAEKIYVHKKYFIQIIINNKGTVVSYAITTRNSKFNPEIPVKIYRGDRRGGSYPYISNLRLGKMKLTDIKDYLPETINIGNWGMLYFYVEANYFGNPGFYKHYLFSLSPSGCCIDKKIFFKLDKFINEKDISIKNPKVNEIRFDIVPNTFAVVNGYGNEKLLEYLIKKGIGPNYYDIREFN